MNFRLAITNYSDLISKAKIASRSGEMIQRLRALTGALLEVPRSIPSNHIVVHNHLYWDLMLSFGINTYNK